MSYRKKNFLSYLKIVIALLALIIWGNAMSYGLSHKLPEKQANTSTIEEFITGAGTELGNRYQTTELSHLQKKILGNLLKTDTSQSNVLEKATVTHISDGDTITVNLNNIDYKLRLIGIDTPESVNPDKSKNTKAGKIASDYTKNALPIGTAVWIQKDTSDTDKYGRILRYVWLSGDVDVDNEQDVKNHMYNAKLLEDKQAVPMTIKPNTKYAELFEKIYENTK